MNFVKINNLLINIYTLKMCEIMFDSKKLEKFARYLHESIPKIIHDLTFNLDVKIKKILKKQISCMNFINKDEFDMQAHILFKTQEKIKKLEKRIEKLESINKLHHPNNY